MAGTLHSYAASAASDPESEDSIVVLLLNFGGILQQITCHYGICTTDHTKQKDVSMFHKDVSHWACQKYVLAGFWSKTYKSKGIGE